MLGEQGAVPLFHSLLRARQVAASFVTGEQSRAGAPVLQDSLVACVASGQVASGGMWAQDFIKQACAWQAGAGADLQAEKRCGC